MKGKQSLQHNSEVTYFKIKIMKPFITTLLLHCVSLYDFVQRVSLILLNNIYLEDIQSIRNICEILINM
jgi:hypothetical protein